MTVRASTVFPVLIPTLIAPPITVFNANALCQLVTVAGDALSKRLTQILNPLVRCIESDTDDDIKEAVNETIRALLGSISDAEGLNTLMLLLLGWAKNEGPVRRVSAVTFFGIFCQETKLDFSLYRVDWIRTLVSLLDDSQMEVVEATWIALDSFVKAIGKDDVEVLVIPLRKTIESTGAPGRYVPGFAVQKGISPVLPIILAGLTGGSNDQREQAAYAIGDLVERTEEAALKPYTTQLTGPLIRVITQATNFPPAVKTAILTALMTMLDVVPTFVKPFFPQLQRTFCKSASDPASLAVRTRAAMALGSLFKSQTRVDPLVTELVGGIRGSDDSIAASLAYALSLVVKNAFANVGEASRQFS
ncbi:translational activator of GCN4 [Tulasnella sp. 418]|nr:translational activator of GCN4 [Tulasnella sp. 418]